MEHLIIKLAHLIVLKKNMALYDYLCDDFDLDPETTASLRRHRNLFMDDALQNTLNTRSVIWLVMAGVQVHKDKLAKEIERNRELRSYVYEIKKLWLAKKERGEVVPECSTSMLLTPVEATDEIFRLPEYLPVTDLCDHVLSTYYYKHEPEVVAALSILNESELPSTPVPFVSQFDLPETPDTDSCSSESPTDFETTCSPMYRDELSYKAKHTPDIEKINGAESRRRKLIYEMESTRLRMSQWLHDQSANYKESVCRRKKPSAVTDLMIREKRRLYQASPRASPGRSQKSRCDCRTAGSPANYRPKYF